MGHKRKARVMVLFGGSIWGRGKNNRSLLEGGPLFALFLRLTWSFFPILSFWIFSWEMTPQKKGGSLVFPAILAFHGAVNGKKNLFLPLKTCEKKSCLALCFKKNKGPKNKEPESFYPKNN